MVSTATTKRAQLAPEQLDGIFAFEHPQLGTFGLGIEPAREPAPQHVAPELKIIAGGE